MAPLGLSWYIGGQMEMEKVKVAARGIHLLSCPFPCLPVVPCRVPSVPAYLHRDPDFEKRVVLLQLLPSFGPYTPLGWDTGLVFHLNQDPFPH